MMFLKLNLVLNLNQEILLFIIQIRISDLAILIKFLDNFNMAKNLK